MPHNNQLQTLRTEIEQAREELNDLIGLDRKNISNKKVVELSQILDNLLVEYLKEQNK
jgi:outer membrane protein TolC